MGLSWDQEAYGLVTIVDMDKWGDMKGQIWDMKSTFLSRIILIDSIKGSHMWDRDGNSNKHNDVNGTISEASIIGGIHQAILIHKKGSKVHRGFLFVLGGMVIFVFLNDIHGVE